MGAQWLLESKYRLAAAGLTLAVLTFMCVALFRHTVPVEVAELPNVLEDRVPLWINAWCSKDVQRLLRLTAPSYDRQLRRWVSSNPPPSELDSSDSPKSEVRLTSVTPQGNEAAEITAEVRFVGRNGRQERLAMRQTWYRASQTWYFLPPSPSSRSMR